MEISDTTGKTKSNVRHKFVLSPQMKQPEHTRRQFLQTLGMSTALCGTLQAGVFRRNDARSVEGKQPNIVFILTDDQRADAMGCAGNPLILTPNIDSLAARGTRFDQAFVTLSICSPSRAACLTGRYGSANGVTTLGPPLNEGERTFAHILKEAGYQTGFVGKWHLGTRPSECGFDFISSFEENGPYYGRLVEEAGREKTIPGFIDDYVAEQSNVFIDKAAKEDVPFVLWMCTQTPHMNNDYDWNAREEFLAQYDRESMPVPETWQDDLTGKPPYLKNSRSRVLALSHGYDEKEAIQRHFQRYYATITQLDASIGKVLRRIEGLGIDDNTWFLFMGENGWFMGEHGFTSKVLPYGESIRIPMIVAGPSTRTQLNGDLVANIDLAATILDLAGVARPANMHGKSLLPLIRKRGESLELSQGQRTQWRDTLLYEAPTSTLGSEPLMAVRTGKWKYIQTYSSSRLDKVVFEELYNMDEDPHEMKNLAIESAYEGTVQELSRRLEQEKLALK